MILYMIKNGIIEAEIVVRETKRGWRQLINGFYNRNELGDFVYLDTIYLTSNFDEAVRWAIKIRAYMSDVIQVSSTSINHINDWNENGAYQDDLPKIKNYCRNYPKRFEFICKGSALVKEQSSD